MTSLERTLILKSGYDHGWEVVVEDTPEKVVLASALHKCRVTIEAVFPETRWWISFSSEALRLEVTRQAWDFILTDEYFGAETAAQLAGLLNTAARIARTLPDAPETKFEQILEEELKKANALGATEVEATIRRRVGQGIFRDSLMDYWGGACAVTGIAMPEILRASHSKPWSECESDAERLNVFNGILLSAHLDALYDRFLISFDPEGGIMLSNQIDSETRVKLNIDNNLKLIWVTESHQIFLEFHRTKFLNP